MTNTAFINTARLDFDRKLDFSMLAKLTNLSMHNASTGEEIPELVRNQDIIITKEFPLGREVIGQLPSTVKLICEAGTGYNNIDVTAARDRGIAVCNVPGYSTDAVAQLAITLMLNLGISLTRQQKMLHGKNFDNFTRHVRVPLCEVRGKALGLIGFGAIAQQVAGIARSLGMNILATTRTHRPEMFPWVDFVGMEDMLTRSDFVSIHCPLTADTRHLIDGDRLKLMKPTAFLLNTSRGAIINEGDLIAALQNGTIAGAGLDVQDPEPPETDNPLFGMDNVILTPHIGWKSLETRQRLVTILAENIESFMAGRPDNRVA